MLKVVGDVINVWCAEVDIGDVPLLGVGVRQTVEVELKAPICSGEAADHGDVVRVQCRAVGGTTNIVVGGELLLQQTDASLLLVRQCDHRSEVLLGQFLEGGAGALAAVASC